MKTDGTPPLIDLYFIIILFNVPFLILYRKMAPRREIHVEDVLAKNLFNLTLHGDTLFFYEEKSREIKEVVAHHTVRWVDLPPVVYPSPPRPPNGQGVVSLERTINPASQMPSLYVLGGCEFGENQLASFCNKEQNLVSISPHMVCRYKMDGPLGPGKLCGPFQANFCPIMNRSYPGQSFHEVVVVSGEDYVKEWCTAKPDVTIVGLGLWDIILGHVVWTPECVKKGVYGDYYLSMLTLFLDKAKTFCTQNRIDFEAWFVGHTFVCLAIPAWFELTPDLASREGTISVKTWEKLRRVCFRDMYPLQNHLWHNFRAIYLCPDMPATHLRTTGVSYLLGPSYSKKYVSQVLAVAAKILCARAKCRVPNDFNLVKSHLLGIPEDNLNLFGEPQSDLVEVAMGAHCGKFLARFLPSGTSFQRLWDGGQL